MSTKSGAMRIASIQIRQVLGQVIQLIHAGSLDGNEDMFEPRIKFALMPLVPTIESAIEVYDNAEATLPVFPVSRRAAPNDVVG